MTPSHFNKNVFFNLGISYDITTLNSLSSKDWILKCLLNHFKSNPIIKAIMIINKWSMIHIHTIGFDSIIKKNEIIPFAGKSIKL